MAFACMRRAPAWTPSARSPSLLRGYYEDVDFGLRARHRGFASVCAPDVYVAHKGSASFKGEKRGLVKRNQRIMRSRFPSHQVDSRAFMLADPLASVRARIEAEVAPLGPVEVILAGGRDYATTLRGRADMLRRSGVPVLLLLWQVENGASVASVELPGAGRPRGEKFRLVRGEPQPALLAFVARLGVARVEIAGPPGAFCATLDALGRSGMSFGLIVSESLEGSPVPLAASPCTATDDDGPCPSCATHFERHRRPLGIGQSLDRMIRLAQSAPSIVIATDDMARNAAERAGTILPLELGSGCPARDVDEPLSATGRRAIVGLLYPRADLASEIFMSRLAARAWVAESPWLFLVIGRSLDDGRLMSNHNLFVTGAVGESELGDVLVHYGVSVLLAPDRWRGFGPVEHWASRLDCCKAYFDWSLGGMPARPGDLALDPRLCDQKAAHLAVDWLSRSTIASIP